MILQQARDLVARVLTAWGTESPVLMTAPVLAELAGVGERHLARAMVEVLNGKDALARVRAAAMMLALDGDFECGILDDDEANAARGTLSAALRADDLRLPALQCVAFLVAPDRNVAKLLPQIVRAGPGDIRLLALVALARFLGGADAADAEVVDVAPGAVAENLREFLVTGSPLERLHAASGLGHMGLVDDVVVAELLKILESSETRLDTIAVLNALSRCGRGNRELHEVLLCRLESSSGDAAIDFLTGYALGKTVTELSGKPLCDAPGAMNSDQTCGLMWGLGAAGAEHPSVKDELAAALSSDDDFERLIASQAICASTRLSRALSLELLERVGVELDLRVLDGLTLSLALAGDRVCDGLADKMASGNVAALVAATMAFGRMGPKGARALLGIAKKTDDLYVRCAMIACFRDMGSARFAVAEELSAFLSESDDPTLRYFTLKALTSLGVAALGALPAVIEVLLDQDSDVREEAEATLRAIGPDALPHIDRVLLFASPELAARLHRARGWMATYDRSSWPALMQFSADQLLGFLHVADCLAGNDPLSLRAMAEMRPHAEIAARLSHQINYTWLHRICRDLTEKVTEGNPVVRKKGAGSVLTKRGHWLAGEIRRYLFERGVIDRFRA
ncbi:MAG: hypothetical protein GC161_06820 [Planctomycetaceae bacterium]|nr:hypothetical protein [Planctomycetaceae bacterium]